MIVFKHLLIAHLFSWELLITKYPHISLSCPSFIQVAGEFKTLINLIINVSESI